MENTIIETLAITDKKVFTRIEDAKRHAELARNTAKKAREKGREDIATKLEADAEELETLAANWAQDTLDEPESDSQEQNAGGNGKEDPNKKTKTQNDSEAEESEADSADQAANSSNKTANQNAGDGLDASNQASGQNDSQDSGQSSQADSQGNSQSNSQKSEDEIKDPTGNKDGDPTSGPQNGQKDQPNTDKPNGLSAGSTQMTDNPQTNSSSSGQSQNDGQSGQQDNNQNDQNDGQSDNKDTDNKQSELDLDGSNGDSSSSDNDQIKDIFGMMNGTIPQNSQMGQPNGGGQRDPNLAEIKQMLGKLSGEAKRGALDGIRDLLKNKTTIKTESLHEKLFSKNNIREIDDDEWADKLNSIIKAAQDLGEPIKVVSQQDKINNLNNIKQMTTNQQIRRGLEKEANIELVKDYQKKKALDNEGRRYTNYRSIDQFKINFYNAIKDQVDLVKKQFKNYNEVNPEADDDRRIDKEISTKYQPDVKIPIVNLYFDRSGSWDDGRSIEIGKQIVATVQEFADAGDIKLNVLYFSNYVTPDENDAGLGGGTGAWNDILQNIIATGANNVVLMTDTDMEGQAANGPVCRVDGCVWFVWRLAYNGSTGGVEIPKKLIGREYNGQFAFKGR